MIAYVSNAGMDAGDCSASTPCRSIGYAYTRLAGRSWIYVLGTAYTIEQTVDVPAGTVTLSSDQAVLTGAAFPLFRLGAGISSNLTIHSVTLGAATNSAAAIDLQGAPGQLSLDDVHLEQPFTCSTGSTLRMTHSNVGAGGTAAGAVTISGSNTRGEIQVTGGVFEYDSNHYVAALGTTGRAITGTSGTITISNTLFETDGATASIVALRGAPQRIAFSTFVDHQSVTAAAIACTADPQLPHADAILDAWNAATSGCGYNYSLFVGGSAPSGTGNIVGNPTTFFVSAQDYHLATGSPARGAATPGLAGGDHDLDANARPLPLGSNPDIGAYEAN